MVHARVKKVAAICIPASLLVAIFGGMSVRDATSPICEGWTGAMLDSCMQTVGNAQLGVIVGSLMFGMVLPLYYTYKSTLPETTKEAHC